MPRNTKSRSTPESPRRRTNGLVTAVAPYTRDTRWATPAARRRTDVVVVDIADRFIDPSTSADDPLALTA